MILKLTSIYLKIYMQVFFFYINKYVYPYKFFFYINYNKYIHLEREGCFIEHCKIPKKGKSKTEEQSIETII